MGETGISWTDKTPGVLRGCSRTCADGSNVSGCGDSTGGGCYAERMAWRIVCMDRARGVPEGKGKYDGLVRMTASGPRWTGVVRLDTDDLMRMLRSRPRTHQRNFFSMSDPFHERLGQWERDRLWAVMLITCLHEAGGMRTYQVLTKRAAEARDYLLDPATQERVARAAGALMEDGDGWFDAIAFRKEGLTHPLIWLGTSVEHQLAGDERIPALLQAPAAVRFLSCEPLLGPIELPQHDQSMGRSHSPLDWVIAGCESGPGARRADVAWFRSLRDQCAGAGVPFFLKQAVCELTLSGRGEPIKFGPGSKGKSGGVLELPYLDGVQYAAFPEMR